MVKRIDLTPITEGRVHLKGFDCVVLRALRAIQAVAMSSRQVRIEFTEVNNENPKSVKCVDCWREHPEVAKTFTPHVVIDLRPAIKRVTKPC